MCLASARLVAAAPPPLFHASFDKGVDADLACGSAVGLFNAGKYAYDWHKADMARKDSLLERVPALRGNGLLTGMNGQAVYFRADGNLNPEEWTVTFWVKALDGKDYLGPQHPGHMQFFEIQGGGWTRFYRYAVHQHLWVLTSRTGPDKNTITQTLRLERTFDRHQWHQFAVSSSATGGVRIFLDGDLAAQDASIITPQTPAWFRIGQSFGGDDAPNRVIDEFKIYGSALTPADVAHAFLRENPLKTAQTARINPTTAQSIVVDGILADDAWADATRLSGFTDLERLSGAPTPTYVWITHDNTFLYLAFQSDIPREARENPETRLLHGILKSATLDHDTNVDHDDCFGIELITCPPEGERYRLFVNAIKTTYEYSISVAREVDLKWDPAWEVESAVTIDGWTVESRIPLADLGVDGIRPGDAWKAQFVRKWKLLKETTDAWEVHTGTKKERGDGLGTLVFSGRPQATVHIEQMSGFDDGHLKLEASVANAGGTPQTACVTIRAGKTRLTEKTLYLKPGQTTRIREHIGLQNHDAGLLRVEITETDAGLLMKQTVPFYVPQPLGLVLRSYPSKGSVALCWELHTAGTEPNSLDAVVRFVARDSGTVQSQQTISPLPGLKGSVDIATGDLPEGTYDVELVIRDDQRDIMKEVVEYRKQPLPEWYGNALGISSRVPPPWLPLDIEGDTLTMWGRRYDFGRGLFPARIVNGGKDLLASPISLHAVTPESECASATEGCDGQWTETTPCRATCTRTQQLGDLRATATCSVEFDGFAWVKLTVTPAKPEVTLHDLRVRIPVLREHAQLINAYDYSLRTTGRLPTDGYQSAMGPRWIGSHEGGIQVLAEHTANWVVADRRRELTVEPEDNAVAIVLHLISKPFKLEQPRTFEFGFIVTPVKPANPRFRDILSMSSRNAPLLQGSGEVGTYVKSAFREHSGLEVVHLWSQGWWHTAGLGKGNPDRTAFYPIPKESLSPSYGCLGTAYGKTVLAAPYARLRETWAASPEFRQFGDEWLPNARAVYVPNTTIPEPMRRVQVCQSARSYQDFYLWGIDQLLRKSSAKALYFDVSKPHHCNNAAHGCGFEVSGAEPTPTHNFRGTRTLLRRIYTLLRTRHPDGLVFFHMSGQVNMPVLSFADALVDGENFASLLDRKENRGYERVLTLDQFAAEYAGQNTFGPYTVVLPQFSRSGAIRADEWEDLGYQHAEYLLGLIFLHNSQLWYPAYIPTKPTNTLYTALDTSGLTSAWTFTGYWKQRFATLPEQVVASAYLAQDRGKALAVVMNLRWEPVTTDIQL